MVIEPLGVIPQLVLFTAVAVAPVTTGEVNVLATAADSQPVDTNLTRV